MANELEEQVLVDDVIDDGVPRVYELGFHLDPELPTEEMKKTYREIRDLTSENGTVVAEGEPIHIQLAYTISRQETSGRLDFNSAYFAWIVYETNAENHSKIITAMGADKRVVRFIDLVTTKDAARHSQELREISLKMPAPAEDTEAAAGAELDAALESAIPAQTSAV